MHLDSKIQEIIPKRFAYLINKGMHNISLFIRFESLGANISSILNSVCIYLYIIYYKNDLFCLDSVLCSFI